MPSPKINENGLTDKEQKFADAWLETFDNASAALAAGYSPRSKAKNKNLGARVWATKMKKRPHVQDYISARLEEHGMGADEVIARIARIASGDIGNFLDGTGCFDIEAVKKSGLTGLIKEMKIRSGPLIDEKPAWVEHELKLYPADDALKQLMKIHGLDRKVVNHSGEVAIKGYATVSPDDWDADKGD